jgi:hypothetical protein
MRHLTRLRWVISPKKASHLSRTILYYFNQLFLIAFIKNALLALFLLYTGWKWTV